jgi:hypothetical protein
MGDCREKWGIIPFWEMVQEREEVEYEVRGRLKSITPHKGASGKGKMSITVSFKWCPLASYDLAFALHPNK